MQFVYKNMQIKLSALVSIFLSNKRKGFLKEEKVHVCLNLKDAAET